MKNKEYENIFSKMLQQHNEETVPFLKKLYCSSIRISSRRVITDLKSLEEGRNVWKSDVYFYEYLLVNKFVIQFLSKEEYSNCLDMIRSGDGDNKLISAHILYTLIEDKKREIINKLNE